MFQCLLIKGWKKQISNTMNCFKLRGDKLISLVGLILIDPQLSINYPEVGNSVYWNVGSTIRYLLTLFSCLLSHYFIYCESFLWSSPLKYATHSHITILLISFSSRRVQISSPVFMCATWNAFVSINSVLTMLNGLFFNVLYATGSMIFSRRNV